jgi:hypothetical protein
MKRIRSPRLYLILLVAMLAGILTAYRLPSFQERVDWRINDLVGRVKYFISPPEKVVFIPQEKAVVPSQTAPSRGCYELLEMVNCWNEQKTLSE